MFWIICMIRHGAYKKYSYVVARNYIFSFKWWYYGPKRDILQYWGTLQVRETIFSFLFSKMNHYIYIREFVFLFFLNELNSMIQIDYITCDIWVHSPPLLPSRAQTKGCLCVCVYVCNIHLIFFLCYYFSAPNFLRLPSPVCPPSYTLTPKNPLLYADILNYPRPLSFRPSVISVPFFPIFSHARARVVA